MIVVEGVVVSIQCFGGARRQEWCLVKDVVYRIANEVLVDGTLT